MDDTEETGYPDNEHDGNARQAKPKQRKSKKARGLPKPVEMDLDDKTTTSYFSLCITGQIVSATFPLGPDRDFIFCRYELVAGPDWQLASGPQNGLTQMSTNKSGHFNDKIVLNMPIEVTYRSTSPFGCE